MTLEQLDKKYILQTYNRNYINFVRGEGSILFAENGDEYIDFASGIAVNSVGHNNPTLVKALQEQVEKIIHISNLQLIEPQAKLAEKICTLANYDGAIFFVQFRCRSK